MEKIQEGVRSSLDVHEFRAFTRNHPSLLYPVVALQKKFQSKILGSLAWKALYKSRMQISEQEQRAALLELNPNLFGNRDFSKSQNHSPGRASARGREEQKLGGTNLEQLPKGTARRPSIRPSQADAATHLPVTSSHGAGHGASSHGAVRRPSMRRPSAIDTAAIHAASALDSARDGHGHGHGHTPIQTPYRRTTIGAVGELSGTFLVFSLI